MSDKVFFSYARADLSEIGSSEQKGTEFIDAFLGDLRQNLAVRGGLPEISLDTRMGSGELWGEKLLSDVNGCTCFLFLYSSNYIKSAWCSREFQVAAERNNRQETNSSGFIIPLVPYKEAWQKLDYIGAYQCSRFRNTDYSSGGLKEMVFGTKSYLGLIGKICDDIWLAVDSSPTPQSLPDKKLSQIALPGDLHFAGAEEDQDFEFYTGRSACPDRVMSLRVARVATDGTYSVYGSKANGSLFQTKVKFNCLISTIASHELANVSDFPKKENKIRQIRLHSGNKHILATDVNGFNMINRTSNSYCFHHMNDEVRALNISTRRRNQVIVGMQSGAIYLFRTNLRFVWSEPEFVGRHDQCVNDIAFAFDDSCVVTSSDDGTIRVWSLDSSGSEHVCQFEDEENENIQFQAFRIYGDNSRSVISIGNTPRTRATKVFVYYFSIDEVMTKKRRPTRTIANINRVDSVHGAYTRNIDISEDGSIAISAGEDGRLVTHDVKAMKEALIIDTHKTRFNACAISPDGKGAVLGDLDGELTLIRI